MKGKTLLYVLCRSDGGVSSQSSPAMARRGARTLFLNASAVMTKGISALSQAHKTLVHASKATTRRVEMSTMRGLPNPR
jgi:hypothetical protein